MKVILPEHSSSENFLNFIDKISGEIPLEEWEKIPSDLSKNLDSYLYGVPKKEEWKLSLQQQNIVEALAYDKHFEQAGFVPLLRS